MNSLWDICIFLGLVPKESHCTYVQHAARNFVLKPGTCRKVDCKGLHTWKTNYVATFDCKLYIWFISYSTTNKMHLFLKLFILVKHSTCFGRSFRPSSGAQDCTYSNRHMSDSCCYLLANGDEMELQFHLVPVSSSSCLACTCCCMCSLELLMMGGKTFRNL
jgi:hypothetical protein